MLRDKASEGGRGPQPPLHHECGHESFGQRSGREIPIVPCKGASLCRHGPWSCITIRWHPWEPSQPSRYRESGLYGFAGLVIFEVDCPLGRIKEVHCETWVRYPQAFGPTYNICHPYLDSSMSTTGTSNRYRIPDNLTNWKWPRHLNPYYPEVKAASAAWARSFGAFSPKAQDAYDRCDFSKRCHVPYDPTPSLTSG